MSIAAWEFDHVRRFPDECGLIFGERTWTNAQLHAQSLRFASALLALGVAPGDRVVIALGNSPELFIACSGTVIAGAALVILGDSPSSDFLAKIAHCEPVVVVCSHHLAPVCATSCQTATVVAAGPPTLAHVRSFDELILRADPLEGFVHVCDDSLVQLCYTSGSTGTPKALPYTHGSLNRFLRSFADVLPDRDTLTPVLVCAPPTAFASRLITLRVLSNNQYILLPKFEPELALAAIERYRARHISLLPTMAEQLVASNARASRDCSSLRSINIGGSHVPAELVARLKQLASKGEGNPSSLRVAVQYGMTEAGGGIAETTEGGDGIVGRAIPGVIIRISRADGSEAQPGEVGEIVVRTPFGPQGYWRDPEASARVFRNGFVHTGDLGHFLAEGQLRIVGRSKELIIQGGTNVHPAELIKVIYPIPGVRECAVVGVPNDLLGEEVVACVAKSEGSDLTEAQIRAECRRSLDPGRQPVRILFFSELPKADGGKVDVAELRREVLRRSQRSFVPDPRRAPITAERASTVIEQELGAILRDEGCLEQPGSRLGSTFGELGLSSRGAVRLAYALSTRFSLEVPATLAYSCPTVDACAAWLVSAAQGHSVPGTTQTAHAETKSRSADEIAVVGMGVRLPGSVGTPREFWELLWDGRDTVCDIPAERSENPDVRARGSFLANAADFDASFFRLSAQAAELDPRHRHLLEVCWEALENAGCDPTSLRGNRTGLFLGLYGERYATTNPLGAAPGMAAGYLCQFFDIQGPVATVDTTCSSSLVAVHLAMESLRRQECDVALVGGANLLSDAQRGDALGVLARDGRTRAFDSSANGFGRGEGCVLLVLKRLADAETAGDRIYAALLGTAINHDGRSNSLTAPNPRSQANVIRLALRSAGLTAEGVQYVEAHGTGTPLGDPIEVEALAESLGASRSAPLAIGSVKTNIGHLEAAAGVAGLAKVVLAISHRRLPASLHYSTPNPRIPWERIPVRVQCRSGNWPEPHRRLIAGASSFGMSGTNAHVIAAEHLPESDAQGAAADAQARLEERWLLPISAASSTALRSAALRWVQELERNDIATSCRDIAFSASCRRAHLPFRLAVTGSSRGEWARNLREFLAGSESAVPHRVPSIPRRLALVFSGQGSQWSGMARELLEREPVFREMLMRCAVLVDARVPWSLLEELDRDESTTRLNDTQIVQPALFAMQVSLYELWKSWGIEPVAAVGHSAGEIAAAYVAGRLTLEEAVGLACERGRICAKIREGAMVAVSMPDTEAAAFCRQGPDEIAIAAVNGPRSTVLAGAPQPIARTVRELRARGVRVRELPGRHAFHSQHMTSAAQELGGRIPDIPQRESGIRLVSGMTGVTAGHMNAAYWSEQLIHRVQFHEAMQTLLADGCTAFLEVSPHPVLLPAMHETFEAHGNTSGSVASSSLGRDRSGVESLLQSLGQLYCAGVAVDWTCRYAIRGRPAEIPGYAWEHVSYWHSATQAARVKATDPPTENENVDEVSPSELLRRELSALTELTLDQIRDSCTLEELGIDSLGLIRLRTRLVRRGISPSHAADASLDTTVGKLLDTLNGASSQAPSSNGKAETSSPLVWFRRDGADPTHVWIHPVGGGIDCYRTLAKSLPNRFMAIESPRLRTEGPALRSVEEIAASYLMHLESAGLGAPLVLAGWSFGGVVAFEMAVQLARKGRLVSRVILVDSYAGAELPQDATGGCMAGDLVKLEDVPAQYRKRVQSVCQAHFDALRAYQPGPYDGEVVSLRAVPAAGDPDRIWRASALRLTLRHLRADHFSIMSPALNDSLVSAVG